MNVAFRVDASIQIGTGHVMRCLTLAHALRHCGALCSFITRALPGHLADFIRSKGFDVTLLSVPQKNAKIENVPPHASWAEVNWEQDAAETRRALGTNSPDWLVVDHYAFDARWQTAVRTQTTKLMVIDDLADRPHNCDLLLDQNLGHSAADYTGLIPDNCELLIGPRYALLRPEFSDMRPSALSNRFGRGFRQLLITMGGVDQYDASSIILKSLRSFSMPKDLKIKVIMGSHAPALERVYALAQEMPWHTEVFVDTPYMANHMALSDLAICAAGGTTWERCCLGLPSIVIETAKNQAGIARELASVGAAEDSGPVENHSFPLVLKAALGKAATPTYLDAMSEKAARICDGDGAARVISAILPSSSFFREAVPADSRRVWEWRRTIDKSLQLVKENTPFVVHHKWFTEALQDPRRIFRIIVFGELPCGYLRLDRRGSHSAEISICLAPEVRNKGLGVKTLKEAERLANVLNIHKIIAMIHPSNEASLRAFKAAGYVEGDAMNVFHSYHRILGEKT
jgi:UDP-2,4-diacetamido-2,4,6-trideoxy-beta-L-altropyranose hydrolase|tara:strand:- start:2578 stop:4122 length:1545 start_codon:yes stop_codon:yes gene_type:complete